MIHLGRLFVSMALLYPWATKEYLLWEITIGQIILYHNKGIEMKYGKSENTPGLADKSYNELKEIRDQAKELAEKEKSDALKAQYATKYGAV